MKPEEAIERINEHIAIHQYNEPHAIHIAEALQMGIDALEKQIPMKIGSKVMDYMGRVKSECGNCGEIVEDTMWSYCPWCGQRIGGE